MKELQKLKQLSTFINPNNPLKPVLEQLKQMVHMVTKWEYVSTSGSAVCRYLGGRTYEIRYQEGNLGNLVHELIHVAVNEAYDQDVINYPTNRTIDVPDRVINANGYCTNEERRQIAFMDRDWINRLSVNLSNLIDLVTHSEIASTEKKLIIEKLKYGMMNPHKEYDTVITQILVWLVQLGYPIITLPKTSSKTYQANIFYDRLEFYVREAYNLRSYGRGHINRVIRINQLSDSDHLIRSCTNRYFILTPWVKLNDRATQIITIDMGVNFCGSDALVP